MGGKYEEESRNFCLVTLRCYVSIMVDDWWLAIKQMGIAI